MENSKESAQLNEAIERSRAWTKAIVELIDGVPFNLGPRGRITISLYHLCIEHYMGIHVLVEAGITGSAFALSRPQFEAFVRAAWCGGCATEAELEEFINDDDPPSINVLIRELEAKHIANNILSRMKDASWDQLCSFTHGGVMQVVARLNETSINQNYSPSHVASLLQLSSSLAYTACIGMCGVVEAEELANKIQDTFHSIYAES